MSFGQATVEFYLLGASSCSSYKLTILFGILAWPLAYWASISFKNYFTGPARKSSFVRLPNRTFFTSSDFQRWSWPFNKPLVSCFSKRRKVHWDQALTTIFFILFKDRFLQGVCKTGGDFSNITFFFWKPLIYCTELRSNYHLKLKGQPLNLSHKI